VDSAKFEEWAFPGNDSATSKVPFLLVPTHCKMSNMDDDSHQADKIARAYLRQLRQQGNGISEKIQKPGLRAWRELEERLMLGPMPNEPKAPKEVESSTPRRTSPNQKPKKAQSIWKRPISDLWR
jgi:hypothetical protein